MLCWCFKLLVQGISLQFIGYHYQCGTCVFVCVFNSLTFFNWDGFVVIGHMMCPLKTDLTPVKHSPMKASCCKGVRISVSSLIAHKTAQKSNTWEDTFAFFILFFFFWGKYKHRCVSIWCNVCFICLCLAGLCSSEQGGRAQWGYEAGCQRLL